MLRPGGARAATALAPSHDRFKAFKLADRMPGVGRQRQFSTYSRGDEAPRPAECGRYIKLELAA